MICYICTILWKRLISPSTRFFMRIAITHIPLANSEFTIIMCKCWILLQPELGVVDDSFHLPLLSMNRLNQTEPATFSILSFWDFFKGSIVSVFCLINTSFGINVFAQLEPWYRKAVMFIFHDKLGTKIWNDKMTWLKFKKKIHLRFC